MSGTRTVTPTAAGYDLVRDRARTDPDAAAVLDLTGAPGPALSYGDLLDRVEALAGRLRACGVGPDQPVAVLVDSPVDTVVVMLAVLAAGGAYCPVDTDAPAARVAATLERLGARTAVADEALEDLLPAGTVTCAPAGPPGQPFTAPAVDRLGLAYVMFTSGSTGQPKGVAMTHAGLDRLIHWQLASGPPGLRTLQFTARSFDVSLQEVLSTLGSGGCLVVVAPGVRRDPDALLYTIVDQRIERLFLPYVALQLLAVAAQRRGVVPDSLRHVVTAGEQLVVTPAIRALFAAVPHCRLDNHYGPTEAHLVTSSTLPPDPADWPTVPSIGSPVDGVRCRVLDERLMPTAVGAVGELYVAGDALARGYVADRARTAERFVADPDVPGDRLYRTGDLVRTGGEGGYEFLGRVDGQLKVRGFRVESGEVEHALLGHPRVDAAAVGLRELTDAVPGLVGYVQTTGAVSARELADHVRALLPGYAVPVRFVPVPELPRTSSGKIDTRALAALALPTAGTESDGDDPGEPLGERSSVEAVTAIWTRVLGHDEFDPADDFFDVGGDSLLATWVVAELGVLLGRPVELSVLLTDSTVEGLAAVLTAGAAVPARSHRCSQILTLRTGPSGRPLFLVHPLGGELLGYRELCRACTAPVRILGVGWSGPSPRIGTALEEIAAVHVEQLRTIEPEGPYRLAGWSFGGVLAYEIAQQITAAGGEVDFLGMLDANPVLDPLTGLAVAQTPFLGMLDSVVARLHGPPGADADLIELTTGGTWLQLMGAPITAGTSIDYLRTVLDTARACMGAAMGYTPRTYAGPVHLFQASGAGAEHQARLAAALRGRCTGPLTIVAVPGDHWGFMRGTDVAATASALDVALERVGMAGV